MTGQPISTRPLSEQEVLLRQKFYESIAAQSSLLDTLSGQLLTLELAIPGLYAAVVKLKAGDKATIVFDAPLGITLGCWGIALLLTLIALVPRNWKVDTSLLRQEPARIGEVLGIEDFFTQSALYKRRLLIGSIVFFFVGVVSAIFTRVGP